MVSTISKDKNSVLDRRPAIVEAESNGATEGHIGQEVRAAGDICVTRLGS
jgi:hypothetical protein